MAGSSTVGLSLEGSILDSSTVGLWLEGSMTGSSTVGLSLEGSIFGSSTVGLSSWSEEADTAVNTGSSVWTEPEMYCMSGGNPDPEP
jgi:hypothetical protein